MAIERPTTLPHNPFFLHALREQIVAFDTLHPELLRQSNLLRFGGEGVRRWMEGYGRALAEIRAGAAEAVENRNNLFLGDALLIHSAHGLLGDVIPASLQDDRGMYGYQLATISSPDPGTSFAHSFRLLQQVLNPEPEADVSTAQEIPDLMRIIDRHGRGVFDINDQWAAAVDLIPGDRQHPFQQLRFTLQVKADDQLRAIRERRVKDGAREKLRGIVDPEQVEETIEFYVRRDFTKSAIVLDVDTIKVLGVDEMAQAIVDTGDWKEVFDPEEIAELRNQYPFDPNIQHLLRSSSTETDAIQRYLQIYPHHPQDAKSTRVDVVLSNAERQRNINDFMTRASEEISHIIDTNMVSNYLHLDLSPRDLIMYVINEISHNKDYNEAIIRRLYASTARLLIKYSPEKVQVFLKKLAEAYEEANRREAKKEIEVYTQQPSLVIDTIIENQLWDRATLQWTVKPSEAPNEVSIVVKRTAINRQF